MFRVVVIESIDQLERAKAHRARHNSMQREKKSKSFSSFEAFENMLTVGRPYPLTKNIQAVCFITYYYTIF